MPQAPAATGIRRWWPLARRALGYAFVALVIWLLMRQAREIDWSAVANALRRYRWPTLLLGASLAAASFAAYSSYDLLARHFTRHALGAGAVLGVAWASYAANLNFGALIGGIGMRLRLYTQLGLRPAKVAQIYAFCVVTNWLGYAALAGAVFVWRPFEMPADWNIGNSGLRLLGGGLLLAVLAYLAACRFSRQREWQVRGHRLPLPGAGIAFAQLALSALNWLLIALIVYVLLHRRIELSSVLGVMLVAAMAGVLTHVPAGLGVLEAVFLALLGPRAGHAELLGALLAYRAIYYLLPLLPALALYLALGGRRQTPAAAAREPPDQSAPRDPPHEG